MDKPLLLTGASGNLGRYLAKCLAEDGWTLRLTDLAPFPDPLPPRATFRLCELADPLEVVRLVEGCGVVAHFGGASTDEWAFESVVDANLRGAYHVYEGARMTGARVIFASSNHAIGFWERSEKLESDCLLKPDSLYGLSKAYGELLGGLYWRKHGVQNVNLRIGSCQPEPEDRRMLSTWLSYADIGRLVIAAARAGSVEHEVIWACSDNAASYWGGDDRTKIGWTPQDSADPYRGQLEGVVSGNETMERYQGGTYTARG